MTGGIRRRVKFFYVVLLVIVVYCVHVMFDTWRQRESIQSQDSTVSRQLLEEKTSKNNGLTTKADDDEKKNRIHRLHQECHKSGLFAEWVFKKAGSKVIGQFYYARNYNVTYCKVPKTGCTFWKELIFVLETENDSDWKDIFAEGRLFVHIRSFRETFLVPFESKERIRSKTVIVSRDPYSRLYSAYIDKVYLGGLRNQVNNIMKYLKVPTESRHVRKPRLDQVKSKKCPNIISFSDFLKYIIYEVSSGHRINEHWIPITALCRPCDIGQVLLAKQESFTDDVENILQILNVDSKRTNFLKQALHDNKVERTIPALIQDIAPKAKSSFKCLPKQDIGERIWRSMQIQGYIDEAMSFPLKESRSSDPSSASALTKVIMGTIKKFPLNSTQSRNQRHKFLVEAYRNVDMDIIKKLQQIYSPDFRLFGYSTDPPS